MEPSTSYSSLSSLPLPFNDPQLDLGGDDYKLLEPTEEEEAEVRRLFAQRPPEGYEIKSIQRVYAPDRIKAFALEARRLQKKFDSKLDKKFEGSKADKEDKDKKLRERVWNLFEKTASIFQSKEYPSVHLLPLWHGTSEANIGSIFEQGYCRYNPKDPGYFGKGFYFTEEAAYASLYSEEEIKQNKEKLKTLLLNWVATCFSYPVIHKDFNTFKGGACYENYDSHFVPVIPVNPSDPKKQAYYGLSTGQAYCYKEFVVFQTAAALPRYVVKIRRIAIKSFYPRNALFHLFQLLRSPIRQSMNAEDIRKSWLALLTPRSSSSSSSSADYTDRLLSRRDLFQKILLNLFPSYASQSIEPDLEALLDKIIENCCTDRSRVLIRQALDLFYRSESSDFEALDRVNWLVLFPLQFAFSFNLKIDLIETAFKACFSQLGERTSTQDFNPLMRYLAKALAEISDVNEVLEYYNLFFPYPELRKEFFKKLEALGWQHLPSLLDIPDKTGFRFSFEKDQLGLHADLLSLMHAQPQATKDLPQVRISFFFQGEKHEGYLDASVVKQLKIDQEGNIHKFYKDASHPVAQIRFNGVDLHFKQNPINPWMEYAMHSLMYRVAGRLTPPTQLVRIEVTVDNRTRVYPVQISRTIEGTTLKDLTGLDKWDQLSDTQKAQWTWLCLCSILTHPGDGRNSNYIVDKDDYIFCIDNDIAFVEPVTSSLVGKTINFGAAPFCYFEETILDRDTLEQFTKLDVEAILDAWVADLLNTEEGNGDSQSRTLFCQEEMDQFKRGYVYKKHLLLREGTLAKLKLQFWYLRRYIKKVLRIKQTISALDLLKALVTLRGDVNFQSNVGGYVYQQYGKSFKERQQDRLNSVLSRTASLTQKDADKAHYGTVLTKEKVATAEEYRLEKAREELYISLVGKSINFNGIGSARQLKTLQALRRKVLETKQSSVTINHCSELDFKFLESFLHSDLVLLDLSYCPKVDTACLELIQKSCPKLQELNITGCNGVKALARWSATAWDFLEFSSLRVLKAHGCPNLVAVRLKLPLIETFYASENSELSQFVLDCPSHSADNPEVDLRDCPQLSTEVKLAYKITALKILRENGIFLNKVPVIFREDLAVVLTAVKENGTALEYADKSLKKNRDVVHTAVSQNGSALEFAHESLKKDCYIVLIAVKKNGYALKFAHENLKRDPDIVLAAVRSKGHALYYAHGDMKSSYNIVFEAVKQNGYALQFADEKLKSDRDFVTAAINHSWYALRHASDDLKRDWNIVTNAILRNRQALCYAHASLKGNREFILAVVKVRGTAIKYAHEDLKSDREIAIAAVRQDGFALLSIYEIWGNDREVVLEAVKQNGRVFEFVRNRFKLDKEIAYTAAAQHSGLIYLADPSLHPPTFG